MKGEDSKGKQFGFTEYPKSRYGYSEDFPGALGLEDHDATQIHLVKPEHACVLELERIANALERLAPTVVQDTQGDDDD